MNPREALEELHRLPLAEIQAWFEDREIPAPGQWWHGLFGSLETRYSPFWRQPPLELEHWAHMGAECVVVASARGKDHFPFAAYWALRFTATLLRHPGLDVPALLTPAGVVSWFLDGLPYSSDAIIVAARTLAEHDDTDYVASDPPVDPPRHVLFDLRRALDVAESLAPHLREDRARRLLAGWLDVRRAAYGTWM